MAPKSSSGSTAKNAHELQGLVDVCNGFQIKDRWIIPSDHAYLCLPDSKEKLRIFGVLQPKVLKNIAWTAYGFDVVPNVKDARSRKVDIHESITKGQFVVPHVGLTPEEMTANFSRMNIDYTGNEHFPALKGAEDKENVGIIAGHPAVRLPDKLGASLGILHVGVHLTVYHKVGNGPLSICVQHRSEKATSYAGLLDQTIAGGYLANESTRDGLCREKKEEYHTVNSLPGVKESSYDGAVVFSAIRPAAANKLAGTIEISAKASYSYKAVEMETDPRDPRNPQAKGKGGEEKEDKRDGNVGWFEWMTTDKVLQELKNGRFKPNCALVMIKFLIDQGVIKPDEPGFEDLKNSLEVPIPLPIPDNLGEYDPRKT